MTLKNTGESEVSALTTTPDEEAQDPRVRKVIALMRDNYHRELTLGKLADSVQLSVWHLCHLFKNETGKPPAQFLKSIRMEEARRLLESTVLSVKEVINKVGMSDQSHFVKDFKRAYGDTPTRYRSSLRAEQPRANAAAASATATHETRHAPAQELRHSQRAGEHKD
ncbi:MAG TPA: AraC family transcriptional regulator [Pyrinomonadaceae bacterium]|nr:AraC family transcriptional regulator [Pyrinomonadaceae bacterium]